MGRDALKNYFSSSKTTMEIGPLCNPFLNKEEYNVFYADIRSTEDVKNMFINDSSVIQENIVSIDYVINNSYLEAVGDKRFDAVFSGHVVEHTPDIISHLGQIAEILNEGGYYAMCIPDKRLTFDYFREVTPFRDAYDVFIHGKNAVERLIIDFNLNAYPSHLSYVNSFNKVLADKIRIGNVKNVMKGYMEGIIQYHYWVFTFHSFLALLRDCLRLNLLPYTLEYAEGTVLNSNEFYVVLKKTYDIQINESLRQNEIMKINGIIENPARSGFDNLMEFINKHSSVYIYGLNFASSILLSKLYTTMNKIVGVIISDEYEKENMNLPVFHLSEAQLTNEVGIIMAMSEKNNRFVKSKLLDNGFSNIYDDMIFIDYWS